MVKKEQLIQEYLAKPIEVGDTVHVKGLGSQDSNSVGLIVKVLKIEAGEIYYDRGYGYKSLQKAPLINCTKYIGDIGYNPFPEKSWDSRIRITGYDLGNMISICGYNRREKKFKNEIIGEVIIPELNWEPTIKDQNGNDIKYQRDFCWTLYDKQLLIESIYNQLDIGKIVVRKRSWNWVENRVKKGQIKGTAFKDIVDGKQRLNAILGFMQNEYPDLNGYFYEDLSKQAQHKFDNFHALAYCEMEEGATDEDVKSVFLNVNFTGKIISQEHIEFVKSIKLN